MAHLQLFGCGGSEKSNHYAKAVSQQEKCCESLGDAQARSQCVDAIVRVDDEGAQGTRINEQTYACVERNFVCDKSTGRATKESSQKAFDCISDLDH